MLPAKPSLLSVCVIFHHRYCFVIMKFNLIFNIIPTLFIFDIFIYVLLFFCVVKVRFNFRKIHSLARQSPTTISFNFSALLCVILCVMYLLSFEEFPSKTKSFIFSFCLIVLICFSFSLIFISYFFSLYPSIRFCSAKRFFSLVERVRRCFCNKLF